MKPDRQLERLSILGVGYNDGREQPFEIVAQNVSNMPG
jgi:hypothetical protein